ncbi:MAG: NIPSNAP family protein [Planctomycetota bacterium]|nr:NIPSNAP family protein [Planctomycetota bacterium]
MSVRVFASSVVALALFAVFATTPTRAADPQPAGAAAAPTTAPAASGRVFEMRKYYALPGRLDALNARFRNHTTALFQKHGMENIGYWVPTEGPEAGKVLVYLLAYPSREAKDAAWKGFANDPDWKKARDESEKDGKIVEKIESTIMNATDYSAIK